MIKDRTLGNTEIYGASGKGRPSEELPEQPSEKGEKHLCASWEPKAEMASRAEGGPAAEVLLSWRGSLPAPSQLFRQKELPPSTVQTPHYSPS